MNQAKHKPIWLTKKILCGKNWGEKEHRLTSEITIHPQPILCRKGRRCSWGICSISVRIGEEIDEGTKLLRPTGSGDPFGRDTDRRGKWKIELDTVSKRNQWPEIIIIYKKYPLVWDWITDQLKGSPDKRIVLTGVSRVRMTVHSTVTPALS